MSRRRGPWVLILLFLFCLPLPAQASRITIDSDAQFSYAQDLMEKGDLAQAIGELKRLIHFFPGDSRVPEARYLIALCHLRAREYEAAAGVAHEVHRDYSESTIGRKALLVLGESYYARGIYGEAQRYFRLAAVDATNPDVLGKARYRLGWSLMKKARWQEASMAFAQVPGESPLGPSASELQAKSLEGATLPGRDPTTAGVLAGVLPGLGHAYCGRYRNATVAFLLNGLFIWAAHQSFQEDLDALGGILTFLELGWYSGNIYSAVNCAHKHNRAVQDAFREGLLDRFDLSLTTTGDRDLGLALSLHF